MRYLGALTLFVTLFLPFFAFAIGVPYAGKTNIVTPCTCSGGFIISYAPFYNGGVFSPAGVLYFQAGVSVPYSKYTQTAPATWQLGQYAPTFGAPSPCFISTGIPPVCIPLPIPVFGIITKVGSGLPSLR